MTQANTSAAPRVSIILACYNSAKYLQQTLDSVRQQSFQDWELIAVNDQSTDATPELLRRAAALDARIRPVDREQRGGRPAITKNTGLGLARGAYIAFIDHDDLYLPDKLAKMVALLDAQPACVAAFHDLQFIDGQGRPAARYLPSFVEDARDYLSPLGQQRYLCSEKFHLFQILRYAGLHTISAVLARERLPEGLLQFRTEYEVCDDTDLWIRLGLQGQLAYLDEVQAQYRIHGDNITSNTTKVHRDISKLIAANYATFSPRLSPSERRALRQRLAHSYQSLAWSLRQDGRRLQAARASWRAFRLLPSPAWLLMLLKSVFRPGRA